MTEALMILIGIDAAVQIGKLIHDRWLVRQMRADTARIEKLRAGIGTKGPTS